jgi:hypothetical protein
LASSALPIIEEFLRGGTPQQRKNALTALTVIGDAASVRMLAEAALGEEDSGVRAHAVNELASLDQARAAPAVGVFERELHGGDRGKQVRAYVLLGQLQNVGSYETEVRLTWRRKLLLAAALYKHLYLVRNWDFRLRSWRAGLIGSLVGCVIFLFAIFRIILRHTDTKEISDYVIIFVLVVLVSTAAGAVMSMTATQRATPINLHISRFAALPAEVLTAALLGFIGILGYYAVVNALPLPSTPKNLQLINFMLLAGSMAGVVRGASALAFGIYANPKVNWLAQTLAGTAAGFLLVAAVALVSVSSTSLFGATGEDIRWVVSMGSLPLAVGCASAFASIDIASPPARSLRGGLGLMLRILFFPVIVVLMLVVTFILSRGTVLS